MAHPVLSVLAVVDRLRGAYTWAPMDRPRRFGLGLPMDRESVARVSCLQADGRAGARGGPAHGANHPKSRREQIAERWIHHPRTGELGPRWGGACAGLCARRVVSLAGHMHALHVCTGRGFLVSASFSHAEHAVPRMRRSPASRRASEQRRRHVRCAIPRAQSWACARMRPTRSAAHPFPSR